MGSPTRPAAGQKRVPAPAHAKVVLLFLDSGLSDTGIGSAVLRSFPSALLTDWITGLLNGLLAGWFAGWFVR